MRKLFGIAAVMAAVCVLGGCGKGSDPSDKTEAPNTEVVRVDVDASEYVELGQYKGLTLESTPTTVSDEEVEEQVKSLCADYATTEEVTDRNDVRDGDTVNINYELYVNGEQNEDYSLEDVEMTIGEGYYVLGDEFDMETGVIGSKVGDTVTLNLKFPEDYEDPEMAGLACEMKIKINSILKEVIPELTDAFIKENTDCNTIAEYREQIRAELESTAEDEAEGADQLALWEKIMDSSKMKKDFTAEMIEQEKNNIMIENEEWAGYFDMDMDSFIQEYYGMSLDDYAAYSLKEQCVTDLILKEEGITLSDDEYKEKVAALMNEYAMESEDELYEYYSEDSLKEEFLSDKMYEVLMSENTFTPAK